MAVGVLVVVVTAVVGGIVGHFARQCAKHIMDPGFFDIQPGSFDIRLARLAKCWVDVQTMELKSPRKGKKKGTVRLGAAGLFIAVRGVGKLNAWKRSFLAPVKMGCSNRPAAQSTANSFITFRRCALVVPQADFLIPITCQGSCMTGRCIVPGTSGRSLRSRSWAPAVCFPFQWTAPWLRRLENRCNFISFNWSTLISGASRESPSCWYAQMMLSHAFLSRVSPRGGQHTPFYHLAFTPKPSRFLGPIRKKRPRQPSLAGRRERPPALRGNRVCFFVRSRASPGAAVLASCFGAASNPTASHTSLITCLRDACENDGFGDSAVFSHDLQDILVPEQSGDVLRNCVTFLAILQSQQTRHQRRDFVQQRHNTLWRRLLSGAGHHDDGRVSLGGPCLQLSCDLPPNATHDKPMFAFLTFFLGGELSKWIARDDREQS